MTQDLDTILAQFNNGERRYGEDLTFTAAVDSLKMGLGVYAVLDHYLKEVNTLRAKLGREMALNRGLTQAVVDKETELRTLKNIVGPEYVPNIEKEHRKCAYCGNVDRMTEVGFAKCYGCEAKTRTSL